MSECKWLHIDKQKPHIGQRCIVWSYKYNSSIFAYWDLDIDKNFCEFVDNEAMIIKAVWWMPEPGPPKIEIKDNE